MSFSFLARCCETAKSPFSLLGSVRTATKRAGGTVRNHGGSPGKRLGLKKFSDQHVIPGNIIVRQRGTQFHPGQNVRIGRDHTIYATAPGFVRFYKQKWLRGDRKFIGVVLHRGEKLPRDETSLGRSRYFGLVDLTAFAKSGPSSQTSA
ncbi:ribosomal L27 protein-domain-containing protein [Suillus americanus]|nr:ribosomal L27 protein-domain-containing protein [Suillus americanus]